MGKYFKGRLINTVGLGLNLYSTPKRRYFSGGAEKEIPSPLNKRFKPLLIRKPTLNTFSLSIFKTKHFHFDPPHLTDT